MIAKCGWRCTGFGGHRRSFFATKPCVHLYCSPSVPYVKDSTYELRQRLCLDSANKNRYAVAATHLSCIDQQHAFYVDSARLVEIDSFTRRIGARMPVSLKTSIVVYMKKSLGVDPKIAEMGG
jgi:hypothetical protein